MSWWKRVLLNLSCVCTDFAGAHNGRYWKWKKIKLLYKNCIYRTWEQDSCLSGRSWRIYFSIQAALPSARTAEYMFIREHYMKPTRLKNDNLILWCPLENIKTFSILLWGNVGTLVNFWGVLGINFPFLQSMNWIWWHSMCVKKQGTWFSFWDLKNGTSLKIVVVI